MANFAPPISRDGFVYHGQLFADVGNLNRHPRASIQDLTELLRPNKPTKDSQAKDQVGHWYFAQLKHYGLPTTKDKNAAKVRLLKAINERQIEVPKDVKKLEAQLKKEYDAANKKAKAELKGGGNTPVPAATTAPATTEKTTSKRKRTDDDAAPKKAPAKKKTASTSTPMPAMPGSSISLGSNGGININIAYQEFLGNVGDPQTGSKKVKTTKTATAAKNTTTGKATASKSTASKSASSTTEAQKKTTKAATTKAATTKAATAKAATAKATTTKAATTKAKPAAAKSTASSSKKPPAKSTAASKDTKPKGTSPKTKKTNQKNACPAPNSTDQRRTSGMIKQEDDYLNSSSAATPFDTGISQFYNYDQTLNSITGIYDIQCTIQDDFPAFCENGCRLMLCRESGTGRVWGSFSWGPFFGVIQLNPGPSRFSQDSLSLGWRAKHLESGGMEFGRGKTGNMVFWNDKDISGQLFDLFGNFVQFSGRRRNGPSNCGFSPAQFAAEWEQYPAIAYGRNQPDDRQSYESEPNHGEYYESEPDEDPYDSDGHGEPYDSEPDNGGSYDSELDHGDHYDSEHDDGQLYNEDGDLNPTGRYELLMRESLGGW